MEVEIGEGLLGMGVLGDRSVKKETLKDYARRLSAFYDYLAESETEVKEGMPDEMDRALVRYANLLYASGDLCCEGEKLKAAVEAFHPTFARRGSQGLPRFARALAGWRKLAPMQPALPIPEIILDAITDKFLSEGMTEEFL